MFQKGEVFLAKNLEIAYLLDFYGEMLTKKQRDFIDLYYNEDLSLSEIAENEGITRQGVRDSIKRAEVQLFDMEEKLGLAYKFDELKKSLDEIKECAEKIYQYNLEHSLSREINDNVTRIKSIAEFLGE
ncbi:MAG: YlxM family DNA-binding protein [Eubacterium sp.]